MLDSRSHCYTKCWRVDLASPWSDVFGIIPPPQVPLPKHRCVLLVAF